MRLQSVEVTLARGGKGKGGKRRGTMVMSARSLAK